MLTDFAKRARALVGTRFRPQGRGADGVDCIGLAILVFGLPSNGLRRDYRLRGDHLAELKREIERHFRKVRRSEERAGDLMLLKVADDQLHLGVRTRAGFVHAHAGIGRVVETPGEPEWPLLGLYRKRRKVR